MGCFFPPPAGELEINELYADNEIYCREVRFSVPAEKWCEFEKSQLFADVTDYVRSLQTPDTQQQSCERRRGWESEELRQSSMTQERYGSFWVQVRKALCEMLRR